jgi:hypothetical protein
MHGSDMAMRHRGADRHRLASGDQRRALQRRLDRIDCLLWQPGQIGQRLMLHLLAVAVGAPQVARLVLAPPALLVRVAAADPGHMHRCCLLAHIATIALNTHRNS